MPTPKSSSRLIGSLFILASAAAIAGGLLLEPLHRDGFPGAAAHRAGLVTGALLEVTLAAAVIAIAALLAPALRRAGEGAALLYVATRTLEAALILAGAVSALVLISVAGHAATTTGMDTLILTGRDWTYHLGTILVFSASAVVLNAQLLRGRLAPRWLAGWGLLGGALLLLRGVIELYDFPLAPAIQAVFAAPIGVQEMVFAGWLIVRGLAPAP